MLSSTFSLTRALRVLAPLAVAVTALGILTPSPKAAAGPLSLAPITWDVIGLDSNNVDTGPNVFPVGVRICNTGSDPATNVQASWSWKTSQNSFETPTQGATVPVGTLAGSACRQAFFDVTLNRSASSRGKARDYQITVTADGGLNVAGPQRQLYVEKLVSQARNTTKKLAGPGGCNLAYTVCDPAPTNLIVGQTYTYKFYAETSTAYKQLETFVNWPAAIVQAVDSSSTYSNPSGATASSIYADACGWSPTTRSCVGPANIAGGKAGGRIVVTYRVTPVAPGSGSLKSTIYDFSGSSYHYNTDYATAALLTSSLNVRYGIVATVTGNGKVTSSLAGTLADGTSSGLDCGVTCEVGHTSGATVTLTAVPLGADTFVGWSGGSCTGASLTCTVTMSQSRTVTAAFTGVTSFPLTVSKVGSGTVNASSGSLACGATCTALYADGASVTLTATPSAGYVFDGWTGEGCSSTGTCTVTMSQARSVTASFTEQTFMLSVATTGNGTVSANLGTISCGNGSTFCSDVYGSGTNVTLTAAAGTNQSFTGWSGACTGTSPTCAVTMTEARSVTAAFSGTTVYTLDVGLSGSGTGTVTSSPAGINCGATCSATYANGTNVTLTASAASGSSFVGWSGDCTGSGATCTVTMSQARDVAAIFGVNYTLLVARDGTGTGTVTSSPSGVNCGATCSASYGDGAVVTLTPTPSAGSIFTGWNGACTGTGTCTVTMDAAKSVTATFTTAFVLSVTKSGSGVGTVASSGDEILCGATCSATFPAGTVVTLAATAATGSRFTGWSGACSGTGTCTVTMAQARLVTATFVPVFTLSVSRGGAGSGMVTGSGIDCGSTCDLDYDSGTSVTLTATAAAGSRFTGWSGACSGTGSCTVTVSQARSVTATFVPVFTLTVTKSGAGSGTVTGSGITCGNTCDLDYDSATSVTLTATAAAGSRFTGWSGACSGTGSCTVTMSQARSVTATFVRLFTLTVITSGSGSVTGSGIDCGSTCTADYDDGTSVTLTATAAAGSRFTGWSGDCSGTGTCTVTMAQARLVTATFVPLFTLSVSKGGAGSGTVTGSGITCGSTCDLDYDSGTSVTLTATAATGSRFTGWSGDCSGTGTCTVTMDAARSVTATFVPVFTLTVSKSGSGAVTGSGINCGSTCSSEYDDGTSLTLTATAATSSPRSRFTGWSGACTGTGSCTVTMDQARSVTATFVRTFLLTVTKSGAGTVTGSGIDCGSDCSERLDDGTNVTLTADAATGSRFTGWSGACTGTGTCTVNMDAEKSVTATFVPVFTLTVTKSGSGAGTVAGSGIDCGSTCSAEHDEGTVVTLTAAAATGSRFTGWSDACSGTGTCTVTMDAEKSVTATFVPVFTLTVSKSGDGSGSVSGSGIDCGSTCSLSYDDGTVVTLTAAATGSRFTGWSGACSGTGSCTVTMDQARSLTATFVPVFTLTVSKSGSGAGTVAGSGIDCGSTCSLSYDDGTGVTLTAATATGSRFTGWSGACSGAGTCTVALDQARSVDAMFSVASGLEPATDVTGGPTTGEQHELTVRRNGSGTGAVTGHAIDCGASCHAEYEAGTFVVLTATAGPGSRFTGWAGAGCSGTGACTIHMSGAREVTATFVAQHFLKVRTGGSGEGRVSGVAAAIRCGRDCESKLDHLTTATLTASPAAGSRFDGWHGACTGTGACRVSITEARRVVATFSRIVPLRVRVEGSGTVVSSDGGSCRTDCRSDLPTGRTVTLVAKPSAGFWFSGWTGSCHDAVRTCTVKADGAQHVRALFVRELDLALSATGGLVFHLPHEQATLGASVHWRGRPLANAEIRVRLACPAGVTFRSLRTDSSGRSDFTFGQEMPNERRLVSCRVTATVTHRGRTASASPRYLRFIHPLWIESRGAPNGRTAVRIWGRAGEHVTLRVNGLGIAHARIGRSGWVDFVSAQIRPGTTLSVSGEAGHHSHTIRG